MTTGDVLSSLNMVGIVERASTIDERLGPEFIPEDLGEDAHRAVDRRLDAWCDAVGRGDPDRLRRRLEWDGLDLATARRALGRVRLRDAAALPAWTGVVADALHLLAGRGTADDAVDFADPDAPQPFEEVLASFVLVARERLAEETRSSGLPLAPAARTALEFALLRELSFAAGELLLERFEAMRAVEQSSWGRLVALAREPESRALYRRFVTDLAAGGLAGLFVEYPVLARNLGTISLHWIEAQAEFLGQLAADLPDLDRAFGDGSVLGEVVALAPALSDMHQGGRSVVAVTFASGRRVVYKPKNLGTEAAYQRLLAWLNDHGAPLSFRTLTVLDRTTHGWSEFVEHLPCNDADEGRRFYERAGMLLCLCYVLEVTDCHYENVLATGEFPVLVDAETLMHHRADSEIPADDNARSEAFERLYHSVLRSGLLPRWELSADRRTAYHLSGLGEADDHELPALGPMWVWINTDRMTRRPGEPRTVVHTNIPLLGGAPLRLQAHGPQVIDGFRRMYEFLLDRRADLLASDHLRDLAREQVRYVFRPTGIYVRILRALHAGRFLRDGADRSIEIERLGRRHVPPRALMVRPDEPPPSWRVFAAERRAMQINDVPFFTARASSDALILAPGDEIGRFFREPSFDLVVDMIDGLSHDDLERQVGFISATLYAHVARETMTMPATTDENERGREPGDAVDPSDEALVAAALAVAESIRSSAIRTRDGSASWIAPQLLVQAGRYQLQPLHFDLYSGVTGVALFLAAADRFAPGAGLAELALAAVRPLRSMLNRRPDHLAESLGIGGAGGLGSIAYGLTRVGDLLDEPALLDDALDAAVLISADLVAADRALDVIGGAAGAILGLLARHETAPDDRLLGRAVVCGEHLLRTRRPTAAGPRAWVTPDGLRTTGFAHGTAGIAYSLLRLYRHTCDERLVEAAREAIAYEDTRYSPEHGTWVDYAERGDPLYLAQWCRGAAGIGLARLGGLDVLDTDQVRADIDLALDATRRSALRGLDQACCGGLGRADVLLTAGRRLGRTDLVDVARAVGAQVVERSAGRGGFVLDPRSPRQLDAPPGFFQGSAGIGYELLRLVRPDELPCVLAWE